MNGFARDGDTVTLTMTQQDFEMLLISLGMAAGCAMREGRPLASWLKLANRLCEGNPHWTPYEVPEADNADPA